LSYFSCFKSGKNTDTEIEKRYGGLFSVILRHKVLMKNEIPLIENKNKPCFIFAKNITAVLPLSKIGSVNTL
jgi:hypothetical protein